MFLSKQNTAYELRISDWSSDVGSADLNGAWGTGEYATAIGWNAWSGGESSTSLGESAFALAGGATALGAGSSADGLNSVALGAGSIADRDNRDRKSTRLNSSH